MRLVRFVGFCVVRVRVCVCVCVCVVFWRRRAAWERKKNFSTKRGLLFVYYYDFYPYVYYSNIIRILISNYAAILLLLHTSCCEIMPTREPIRLQSKV